ncbi:MAG: hypothetical protein MHMPM18_004886 [Marteilia pararefringens]
MDSDTMGDVNMSIKEKFDENLIRRIFGISTRFTELSFGLSSQHSSSYRKSLENLSFELLNSKSM